MDAGLRILLLDGSSTVISAPLDATLSSLRPEIDEALGLRSSEGGTCGFFTIAENGLDLYVSGDTTVREVHSRTHALIKTLLYNVIYPDVSGVRAIFDDVKLRWKFYSPGLFTEATVSYKKLLLYYSIDLLKKGRLLLQEEQGLEDDSSLCSHILAAVFGGYLSGYGGRAVPEQVHLFLELAGWASEDCTETAILRAFREAKRLCSLHTPAEILDLTLYRLAQLRLFGALVYPGTLIRTLQNGEGGEIIKPHGPTVSPIAPGHVKPQFKGPLPVVLPPTPAVAQSPSLMMESVQGTFQNSFQRDRAKDLGELPEISIGTASSMVRSMSLDSTMLTSRSSFRRRRKPLECYLVFSPSKFLVVSRATMQVVYEEQQSSLCRLYHYAECVSLELDDTANLRHYNVVVHYPDAFARHVEFYFVTNAEKAIRDEGR